MPGFNLFKQEFFQKIILAGRSEVTFKTYLRAIAQTCLHYKQLPLSLSDDQINTYLTLYKTGQLGRPTPSEAYFKHTVFGFRYLFKTFDLLNRKVGMPQMKRKKPLRDIMNRTEVMQLLMAAKLSKHKIAFALAYGSGLRISELVNVKVADIDIVRLTVHVRNGKGGSDRFVPISQDFTRGYLKYIQDHPIQSYLFPGQVKGSALSVSAMQHALITARRKAGYLEENLNAQYTTYLCCTLP